jgi:hypothetical protein
MEYVIGSSTTFQSRHWLDQGTGITVVGTDYLILNDGRQSAVIRLDGALRAAIVEILNTDLVNCEGRGIGSKLDDSDDLDIFCTDRGEAHMEWLELSVGGVKVYLEERDVPALAKLLALQHTTNKGEL